MAQDDQYIPNTRRETSPGQAPDASVDARDMVPEVPDENIKAPVERVPADKPDIPAKNRQEAQAAKDELLEGEETDSDEQRK